MQDPRRADVPIVTEPAIGHKRQQDAEHDLPAAESAAQICSTRAGDHKRAKAAPIGLVKEGAGCDEGERDDDRHNVGQNQHRGLHLAYHGTNPSLAGPFSRVA